MFKLVYTAWALRDLCDILDYYDNVLCEHEAGLRIVSGIKAAVKNLRLNPFMYKPYDRKPFKEAGFREFPVRKYAVFYRADEENAVVEIVRIIYGKRNINTLMNFKDYN